MNENRFNRLETLLNKALASDGEMLAALAPLSGKILSLEFINSEFQIYLLPGSDGIGVCRTIDGDPNVRIRGTVADMFAYLMASRINDDNFSGSLEIIGDIALAQRFQSVMKQFDFDWEEQLSLVTGDVVARRLGNLARSGLKFMLDTGRTLGLDVSEYLRYEKELLPDRGEIEEYATQVEALHQVVEKLRHRIDDLQDGKVPGY